MVEMAQPDPLGPITTWPYFRNVSDEEAVRLLNEVVNPTNTARYIIVNPIYMIRKYELFPDDETIFVVVVIDKFSDVHRAIIKKVEGRYTFIDTDGETSLNDPDVRNQSNSRWAGKLFETINEMVQTRFGEDAKPFGEDTKPVILALFPKLPAKGGRRKKHTRRHKKRITRKRTKKHYKRN
jgi:hypothetical protein